MDENVIVIVHMGNNVVRVECHSVFHEKTGDLKTYRNGKLTYLFAHGKYDYVEVQRLDNSTDV